MGNLGWQITALQGRHLLLYLLPRRLRTRILVRRMLREDYPNWDFERAGPITILTPWGDYEALSHRGRIREARRLSAAMNQARRIP